MSMDDRWFGVRVLFESVHQGHDDPDRFFEDKLILIRADSQDNARSKAEELCKRSEPEYENVYGQSVAWRFKEVLDVKEIFEHTIGDGTEVYYTHLKSKELEHLRRMLRPFDD